MARKLDENVFWNFCLFFPSVGFKNIWFKMEEEKKSIVVNKIWNLTGRQTHRGHHRKMTLKDDNLTSRQDEGLTERRHHRNLTLQEHDITKRQPYKKTTFQKDRKKVLLEDDNSLPSYPIWFWAWPSSAPACWSFLSWLTLYHNFE